MPTDVLRICYNRCINSPQGERTGKVSSKANSEQRVIKETLFGQISKKWFRYGFTKGVRNKKRQLQRDELTVIDILSRYPR